MNEIREAQGLPALPLDFVFPLKDKSGRGTRGQRKGRLAQGSGMVRVGFREAKREPWGGEGGLDLRRGTPESGLSTRTTE